MPQRDFQVEAEPVIPDGFWPGQPIEAEGRNDLEALMLDAAAILERVGGTFSIMALRRELTDVNGDPTGLFVTVGYRAKWESFAPAHRAQSRPAAPEQQVETEVEVEADQAIEEAAAALQEDDFGPDAEEALAAAGAE